MIRSIAALAAATALAPAPASAPSRDEALRCWLMTHPNSAPLPLDHWPALNRGRSRFA